MKAPLLASHDGKGAVTVSGWIRYVFEGARGTFPCAQKLPLAPSNSPTPLKTRS